MAQGSDLVKRAAKSCKEALAMTYALYDVHSLRQCMMSRLRQFMFWIKTYAEINQSFYVILTNKREARTGMSS